MSQGYQPPYGEKMNNPTYDVIVFGATSFVGQILCRYLLQEFGLEVAGVVQPSHGLTPSAAELRDMVKLLQREKIHVVFTEDTFPAPMLKVLQDEGGAKVYTITHIASGAYTADKFEREMQKNVDTMIRALVTEG